MATAHYLKCRDCDWEAESPRFWTDQEDQRQAHLADNPGHLVRDAFKEA